MAREDPKVPRNPKEHLSPAAKELDEAYSVADLRAKEIAKESPKRAHPLNPQAMAVLRRRCWEAKASGVVNVAVDVNLLIELLNASLHASHHGFVSEFTV